MFLLYYLIIFGILGIALVVFYIIKYNSIPVNIWKPSIAWTRAFIYFSICNIIIAVSGTLKELIEQPIFINFQI